MTLLLGLGIKMAILPFHSWLPTTYEAAHPNTTALIAAVVGKLGVYGMFRIVLPLTPLAMIHYFQFIFGALGAIAIVYGAMIALGQTDLRRLLAYSSLSHLGFVTLGLMAMNREGLAGASIQMFNHGLITAAMFLLLGTIEQRRGRLALNDESRGLASSYPRIGTLMVFFTLAAAGLPGLNSFVGELLAMTGMIRVSLPITIIAVLGTVLGAWYSLRVLQYLMFGSDGRTTSKTNLLSDLGATELVALVPIAMLCLAIGVYPGAAVNFLKSDTDKMALALEPAVKVMHPSVDSSMLLSQAE
jgi:NADH-quinone oxidoreductase subunit M